MKDFMMIFLGPSYDELGMSPEEIQDNMGKWFAWSNKLGESGKLKGGQALHATGKRITGADRVIKDGPFVEGKELIGGYFIVSAENVEEVIEMAQGFPDFDNQGSVEIREVMVFEQ